MLLSPACAPPFLVFHLSPNMLFFNRSTSAGLPPTQTSFWGKLKPKNKEGDLRQQATTQMAIARQRLVTLVCGEHETLHLVSSHPLCFLLGI